MVFHTSRVLSTGGLAAVVAVAWILLPLPAMAQDIDVESAKQAFSALDRFQQDVHEMGRIAATPLGPFELSGRCTYCSKHFIFCVEHTTEGWRRTVDFKRTREPLSRALRDAEHHAGTFDSSYEPMRQWLRGIPRLSFSFEEAETTVAAVREEIRQGNGPSESQRQRVERVLRDLTHELEASSADLSDAIRVLTRFMDTQNAEVHAIDQARHTLEKSGHDALQKMQQDVRTQRCGADAAIAKFHQLEGQFKASIEAISASFRNLESSGRQVEQKLATLVGNVVSSQTKIRDVLNLVEATGKDRLGSFLEQLHLNSAKDQWKLLAEHAGVQVAAQYYATSASVEYAEGTLGE